MDLQLTRDEARYIVNYFFPYLQRFCEMKIRETQANADHQLSCMVILSLFQEIQKIFEKKLNGEAIKFYFKFNNSQGITLYKLLLSFPINEPAIVYPNILRQAIINALHKQLP